MIRVANYRLSSEFKIPVFGGVFLNIWLGFSDDTRLVEVEEDDSVLAMCLP
jgi:hypothetical protein